MTRIHYYIDGRHDDGPPQEGFDFGTLDRDDCHDLEAWAEAVAAHLAHEDTEYYGESEHGGIEMWLRRPGETEWTRFLVHGEPDWIFRAVREQS